MGVWGLPIFGRLGALIHPPVEAGLVSHLLVTLFLIKLAVEDLKTCTLCLVILGGVDNRVLPPSLSISAATHVVCFLVL